MRVVVDTNLWISFLFGKRISELITFLEERKIEIITSPRQVAEIEEVLKRPKIRKFAGVERTTVMRRFLLRKTLAVNPTKRIHLCRDPDDDFILEIAATGKADYIVTGDGDLLDLDPFRKIRIISYREFREILRIY